MTGGIRKGQDHASRLRRFWVPLLTLTVLLLPLAPVQAAAARTSASQSAAGPFRAPAGGQVGTGLPGSCTEAALDTALAGGGAVTFGCGGPATIQLTAAKTITADSTLIGGDVITLTGGSSTRLFVVNPGVTLQLEHIVLDGGASTGSDGGAIEDLGTLNLKSSTIQKQPHR